MTYTRVVHIATSGRRFRTYVGRFSDRARIPGGPRPIEQIIGFAAVLGLTMIAAATLPYNALGIVAAGVALACLVAVGLGFIKYDGVPVAGKVLRTAALLIDRKPTVLAREELDRQAAANPHAFILADDPAAPAVSAVRNHTEVRR